MKRLFLFHALAVAPFLCGCASVPKDAGFADVQRLTAQRTGYLVEWNGRTADDRAVEQKVRQLLMRPLTVDAAVQIALLNNRHLQATFEDLGISQADLVQAGLLKNPVFDLGVRIPDRGPSGTYLDFAAVEDFLDVALIPARKKLAQAQFEQTRADVCAQVLSMAADAQIAFFDYQAAQQLLSLQQSIAQTEDASLQVASQLRKAGNINDLEFDSQRAEDVWAKVDLASAQAAVDETRQRLNDLMAVCGQDAQWTAAPRLADIPAAEISPDDLERLALRQREDIQAARQEVLVQARTLGLTADFRFFQNVDVGPEFERETDGQWRIGPAVSVPLPLFDQGQARIARAQAILRQSEDRLYAMTVDVRSQVRQAALRLINARRKAMLYRDQVIPIQGDLLKQTQLEFNGMFVGVFQLLEARRNQIDAQRQYIEALGDYWTARAQLQQAIGGRLPAATTRPVSQ